MPTFLDSSRALALSIFIASIAVLQSNVVSADIIQPSDVIAIPDGAVGSGNGTLDWRMFTFSGSEVDNQSGAFDGDNANTSLPQGGGADTSSFAESFVTTAGELQSYYVLNFPNGGGGSSVDELVLFLDLNETGGGQPINRLVTLDIVVNPASIQGNPIPSGDVDGATQEAIDQVYTGGTLAANLGTSPLVVPVNAQGAGFADYSIFTGINPFSLNASDVVLINLSMDTLNNGAEEIFLSGDFSGDDIMAAIPEPSTWALLAASSVACLILARRRRKSSVRS